MAAPIDSGEEISARERWKAYAVLAVIFFPTLACIALGREYWPYSNFSMYSRSLTEPVCRQYKLVLTGEAGTETIQADAALVPMGAAGFAVLVNKLQKEDGGRVRIERIMQVIARKYESQSANQTGDPPYTQLQLIEHQWDMKPLAENYDHPDRITVLTEIELFDSPAE